MAEYAPYTGLYINLNRSIERRRRIEEQLTKFDLCGRYARFMAIDGGDIAPREALLPGEVACFHSHYQALTKGAESGLPVHILEDDILLSKYLDETARRLISSSVFDQFDIVFTETFVHTNVLRLASYKQAFDHALAGGKDCVKFIVMDLRKRQMAGMTSYFVAAKSVEKVLKIFEKGLARGPTMPVDLCLRLAAQEDRLTVGCWFPFVTSIMLDCVTATTIAGRRNQHDNPSVMLPALLRYSFFVDRDLEGYAKPFLEALIGDESGKAIDVHRDFILRLLESIMAGRYRSF